MRTLVLVLAVLCGSCVSRPTSTSAHAWGKPCDDCIAGVVNFTKVSDRLWRGAQPDAQGFEQLANAGVKTVINLRHDHDDYPALQDTKLHYLWIPMRAFRPQEDEVIVFLSGLRRVLADPNRWPVYVHCAEGRDRTGYAIAAYRIVEQQWDPQSAIQEMFDHRFNTIWFLNPGFLHRLSERRLEIAARVARTP